MLPGDELLPDADLVATRAISIAASPAEVWPWLVQIGVGRAGAYAYDWLDRLFGLDMRSSRRIVPELQGLAVGDMVPVANDGTGLRVRAIERERVLATLHRRRDVGVDLDPGARRRRHAAHQPHPDGDRPPVVARPVATRLLLVPASWVMERRMLLGLRDRAEGRVDAATRASPEARSGHGYAATEIAPEVYLLGPWGRTQTNAYLVRDGSSWILVDAGWEKDGPRIQAAARSLLEPGLSPSAILLTHAHPDHDGVGPRAGPGLGMPRLPAPRRGPARHRRLRGHGEVRRAAGPLADPAPHARHRRTPTRRRSSPAGSLAGIVRPLPPGGAIPGMDGWALDPHAGPHPGSRRVRPGTRPGRHQRRRHRDPEGQRLVGPPAAGAGPLRPALVHDLGSGGGDRLDRRDRRPRTLRPCRRSRPAAGGSWTAAAVRAFATRTTRDPCA